MTPAQIRAENTITDRIQGNELRSNSEEAVILLKGTQRKKHCVLMYRSNTNGAVKVKKLLTELVLKTLIFKSVSFL